MKDFLAYLLKNIVDKPEAVTISETTDATSTNVYNLTVDPSDMGKVIGKGGRIIKSIRDLARVLATKQNSRINVILSGD